MAKNIKVSTTEKFISSFSGSVPVGTVVETLGYTTEGDGGGASWKKTATTGTASQSPAQLGNALLNDASGNQWALVVSDWINIRSLGAVGDGANDDTLPIRAAVEGSKTVLLPQGNYRITGQISLPEGCTFFGMNSRGNILQEVDTRSDDYTAIISVDFGSGYEDLGVGTTSVSDRTDYFDNAAIVLNTGCTISGIGFNYPNQNMLNNDTVTTPPTKYAPAIIVSYLAEATSINNINIGNCYVGIDIRKEHNACRTQNIYGSPLSIGIRTGSTLGFDDIQNVNFVLGNAYKDPKSPNQGMIDWVGANAICIEQNRSTWIDFTNIKSFGYNIGINIFASAVDVTNGLTQTASGQTCTYTGCGFDFCAYGIKGTDTFYLSIVGCSFTPKHKDQTLLADTYAVHIDNFGSSEYNITITNCSVHAADMSAFYLKDVNNFNISNNQIAELSALKAGVGVSVIDCTQGTVSGNSINGKDAAGTTGIYAEGCTSIIIANNPLSDINGSPIEIKDIAFSVVQGNTGISNSGFLIVDSSVTAGYENVISDNVGVLESLDTDDSDVDANGILNVSVGRNFISHTGVNDIKGITAGYIGQLITIRFSSTAAVAGVIDADAGTAQPKRFFTAGNYLFGFGDTIQIVSRGSLGWYETSRSVN